MASAPTKTTVVKTVNNITGVTTAKRTVVSGGSSSTTTTKTIGTKVSAPKKAAAKAKATKAPAKAAGTVLEAGTPWIIGPNESGWTMCGPVAVANHLLAVTGVEASNGDIERLYRTAGGIGDTGAPLEFCLAAAHVSGLAGCR